MIFGSVCYALSLALSLSVLVFLGSGEAWSFKNLGGIGLMALALFTGIFVRNKIYNLIMIIMISYAAWEIHSYSGFQGDAKSATQIKNDAVVIGIFAYMGWLLTATYFLWKLAERLARWKAKSLAFNRDIKR
ncbi:hypothetical protein [Bosea sp. BK604]|uniref:hypothetical protein n=1 Tax=Bosea sp. BK604 TaxID=2512180 RepID=UPI001050020E|nr:hypothetical protein [Bosea sp. BK604]TCR65673.1 hypothetical protein EV560_105436 [Bosea sp. BK604]